MCESHHRHTIRHQLQTIHESQSSHITLTKIFRHQQPHAATQASDQTGKHGESATGIDTHKSGKIRKMTWCFCDVNLIVMRESATILPRTNASENWQNPEDDTAILFVWESDSAFLTFCSDNVEL